MPDICTESVPCDICKTEFYSMAGLTIHKIIYHGDSLN